MLLAFVPIARESLPVRFNGGELDRLRALRVVVHLQLMILGDTLPLVLDLQSHQIEKVLEFQLHDVESATILNSRLIILVQRDVLGLLFVHHRAARMIGFCSIHV